MRPISRMANQQKRGQQLSANPLDFLKFVIRREMDQKAAFNPTVSNKRLEYSGGETHPPPVASVGQYVPHGPRIQSLILLRGNQQIDLNYRHTNIGRTTC